MDRKQERIFVAQSARALMEDAGFQYTWVAGVESVDEDPENGGFILNGYTWDRNMPNAALLSLAADMLKSVHKKSGMSFEYMLMIIFKNIADADDDDEDDKEE